MVLITIMMTMVKFTKAKVEHITSLQLNNNTGCGEVSGLTMVMIKWITIAMVIICI